MFGIQTEAWPGDGFRLASGEGGGETGAPNPFPEISVSASSQSPEWQILTCPSCAGLFKVPRNPAATRGQVKCPRCHAVTPVPETQGDGPAPVSTEPSRTDSASPEKPETSATPEKPAGGGGGRSIPTTRAYDPDGLLARSRTKEDWERKAPELRTVDFKDKLAKTTDPALQRKEDAPVRVRKDWRREKAVADLTAWETGEGKPVVRLPGRWSRTLRWSMTALAGLGVLALAAVLIRMIIAANNTETASVGELEGPPALLEDMAVVDYREEVWEAVVNFTRASTPEEMLPLIRERERVEPLLRAWYAKKPEALNPFEPRRKPEFAELKAVRNFVVFSLELPDYSRHPIALEKTPEGFLVDWESYAVYSEMPWEELQNERPTAPVLVRAIMEPVEFLPMNGVDPTTHRCFRLTAPNSEETFYAYLPLGGKMHQDIVKSMLPMPGMRPPTSLHAVLRVRYPEENASRKQVLITDYLIKGWVLRNGEAAEDPSTGLLGEEQPGEAAGKDEGKEKEDGAEK